MPVPPAPAPAPVTAKSARPPIDRDVPATVATATFALG